jgi:hypothetical protein
MSSVIAAPGLIATGATDLRNIGSTLSAAHAAAALPTTAMVAAAEDEVSAAIAAVFSAHGQGFQTLGAQAAAFHAQFVQALSSGAGSYVSAEAANVAAFTANPAQTIGAGSAGPNQCAHPGAVGAPANRQRRQRGHGDHPGGQHARHRYLRVAAHAHPGNAGSNLHRHTVTGKQNSSRFAVCIKRCPGLPPAQPRHSTEPCHRRTFFAGVQQHPAKILAVAAGGNGPAHHI